jgi:RimJ/RimL family protein N-acetyltransferase
MMVAPVISTERLTLRPHVPADFEPLYALFASERAQFMGGPFTAKQMWYWIAAEVGSWSLKGFGSWGIERKFDAAFMGQIGINQPHHFPEPELGWVLLKDFEGHGFAREAATAAIEWWWCAVKAPTLASYITPGNTRSEALARRLGAQPDSLAARPEGEDENETKVWRHPCPEALQ